MTAEPAPAREGPASPGLRSAETAATGEGPASPGLRSAGSEATGATREGGADEAPSRASGASAIISAQPIPLVNIANALTTLRVLLVPVFGAFVVASELSNDGWRVAATVAFAVASITDYIDGWIARRLNLVTSFGKVADPIADKALIGTALVLLSAYGAVPWWVTALILVREIGITAMRFLVLRHGVIPASPGGKLKTMLQSIGIGWLLLPLPEGLWNVGLVVVYAAMGVTVVTGIDYVVRAVRLRRAAR
jgi:CDP-diacylglycerol--glycerol-3-phosphate 3-phosphatidyltransferase